MLVEKNIVVYSTCEHHLLPFFGKAHVAYIPDGYITGLSKIARVVDIFAHRLQGNINNGRAYTNNLDIIHVVIPLYRQSQTV